MEIFSPKGFSNSAGSGEECCDTPRTGEDQGCYPQTLKLQFLQGLVADQLGVYKSG